MLEFHLYNIIFLPLVILFISFRHLNLRKEFKINKYLKLKLEGGKTNIYVKNRRFMQCMYLLLNISVDRIEDYDEIESIDEAATKLDRSMERNHNTVPPETEFWGHCSNLQAWAENGYDTRILHRNLAFPLLKRLSEVGDPLARKVFSEEIAIRLASKHPSVSQYLTQNGYLKYLSPDEFESILDDINSSALKDIITELKFILEHNQNINLVPPINSLINRILRNFGIEHISLLTSKIIKEIPEKMREVFIKSVYNLLKSRNKFPLIQYINKHLEYLKDNEFEHSFIKYNERIIGIFKNEKVYLNNQNIQNLTSLNLTNNKFDEIKELDLSDNIISDLKGIEKFSNVRILKLNNNKISQIDGNECLKNLEKLFLRNNQIKVIRNLKNFNNLKHLDLSDNPTITEIPEDLNNLSKLETVKLWNCHINKFSKFTEKIFWMNQNYRYFTGYDENDKTFYESAYRRVASSDNKLYKHFVEWVLKMKRFMKVYKFSYQEINSYKEETSKNAIWSGRITKDFKKWLDDKKHQKKIISFI